MKSNLKRFSTGSPDADSNVVSKKTKTSMDEIFSLSDGKKVSVASFKGTTPLVNIREYYEVEGEYKPGKKGIALRVNQWNTLRDLIPIVDAHLPPAVEFTEDFSQIIDEKTKLTISSYKGKQLVQVREVYKDSKSGEMRFGSKGVALSVDEWRQLCTQSEAIDAAVANLVVDAENVERASSSSSSSSVAQVTGKDSAIPEDSFSLGDSRKVVVSMFKDAVLVHIREYYQNEGGVELPGKKGIALSLPQWQELEKVRSQLEMDKSFPLGSKRRVTLSIYKGKQLYNLREFYEDKATGEHKPGSKGIALSESQWTQLNKQWDDINTSITKCEKMITP